ncbi:MAG: hypothetical protein R3B45_16060 [Bdellovibrionota bacterium]
MPFLAFYSLIIFCTGCAYRFTNIHSNPPADVKTIAFESVFDSSQKVAPHEILWESIQQAFAANGKLRITKPEKADAFVQIHLSQFSSKQISPTTLPKKQDEIIFDPTNPALPSQYNKLTQPDVLADKEIQNIKVEIKIWHLKKQELLFQKTYQLGRSYKLLDNATTTTDNQFLRAEEAFQTNFTKLSQNISAAIVRDFLGNR